jgi:tripartite ATP-independent transporter DctM subunit
MLRLKCLDRLEQFSLDLTKYINSVGVCFLALMMLVTNVDVFGRFLFNLPVTGSLEITGFLLLITIMLGIPYAAARDQHIKIDLLTSKMGDSAKLKVESLALLTGLSLFVILSWCSVDHALLMGKLNRVTAVLEMPLSPFIYIVTFSFFMTCFVLVIKLARKAAQGICDLKSAALWILSGLFLVLAIYALSVWCRALPWRMGPISVGIIGMLILFTVFLSGLPVMSALTLVGFWGMAYLRGVPAGLSVMGSTPFDTVSAYTFSVIPLFVLMGEFCFFSGLGTDLYRMAYRWTGHLPGGLAMGTIVGCGGFAAVCGDSMATAVTMGSVALPEMEKYKYDPRLAVGCVAAGGALGVLIPPSLAFILYALLADQSIATLFIAGILPGILLISLFMLTVHIQTQINPALAPPGPKTSMKEKVQALKGVWATLALFVLVIGGMYAGVFTPTEGGGVGALGALIIGVARRRLNWNKFIDSLLEAGKISAVCISILMGAKIFSYFLAVSKLPMMLASTVAQLPYPPLIILLAILVIYLILGCLMPAIPMLILTVPIFFPVVMALHFDAIWFGVVMVLMFEMAVITPPMGINVLALACLREDCSLYSMFQGTIPFLAAMIVCVGLLILLPDIALFLPGLLK